MTRGGITSVSARAPGGTTPWSPLSEARRAAASRHHVCQCPGAAWRPPPSHAAAAVSNRRRRRAAGSVRAFLFRNTGQKNLLLEGEYAAQAGASEAGRRRRPGRAARLQLATGACALCASLLPRSVPRACSSALTAPCIGAPGDEQVHKDEPAAKRRTPQKRKASSECVAEPLPVDNHVEQESPPPLPSWLKKSRSRTDSPSKTSVVAPEDAAPANAAAARHDPAPAAAASAAQTPAKTRTGESEGASERDEEGLVLPSIQHSTPSKASAARAHRGRDLVAMAQQTGREQASKATAAPAAVSPEAASDSALPEALTFLETERRRASMADARSKQDAVGPAGGSHTNSAMEAALSFLESEKSLSDVSCLIRPWGGRWSD